MTINSISRNSLAPVIEIQNANGVVISPARIDIREAVVSKNVGEIRQFSHLQGDSWGNVGVRCLGDARHWWIVAELSGVIDPFTALTPTSTQSSSGGIKLKAPSVESLFLDILTQG